MKRLLTNIKVWTVGVLGALLLYLLYLSLRKSFVYSPEFDPQDHSAKIVAFWHRRQLMLAPFYTAKLQTHRRGIFMLISGHADGRMIATAVRLLGVRSVAGSSTRGGQEALLALVDRLQKGYDAGITPDGPRGPIFKSKPGVLALAAKTGARIYPLSFSAERCWEFKSWDRMILPKPFSRAVFYVGAPFKPLPKDISGQPFEQQRQEFDQWLMQSEIFIDKFEYDAPPV